MKSYDNVMLTHRALIRLYRTAWAFDLGCLSLWAWLQTKELYRRTKGGTRELQREMKKAMRAKESKEPEKDEKDKSRSRQFSESGQRREASLLYPSFYCMVQLSSAQLNSLLSPGTFLSLVL